MPVEIEGAGETRYDVKLKLIYIMQEEYDMQADAHVSAATIDSLKLNISADGRCDSPGHSALYCIVIFMQVETSLILATENVKV